MATATAPTRCYICKKEKATFLCRGCKGDFCFSHLNDHRQELSQRFDGIETERDLFRQTLLEFQQDSEKHALMQQIDQWEHRSMEIIRQTAEETRQLLRKNNSEFVQRLEGQLTRLTDELKRTRKEVDLDELDLIRLTTELEQLSKQLNDQANVLLVEDASRALIPHITINVSAWSNDTRVALRSRANGKFVSAQHGDNNHLVADRSSVSAWETFDIIRLEDNRIALKLHANGKYVCAEDAGRGPLDANHSEIEAWERFRLIDLGDDKVALLAANDQYVCADSFGWKALVANRTKIHNWETFDLVRQ